MKSVTRVDLGRLSIEAASLPRKRRNHNLHQRLDDPVQRLVNALEPGTYLRPHRHGPDTWELFVLLEGACSVLQFAADGVVTERVDLDAGGTIIAEIPEGVWHAAVSLKPGTAILEIKPGPYLPTPPEGFAAWSPPEGCSAAAEFVAWMSSARAGDRPPAAP